MCSFYFFCKPFQQLRKNKLSLLYLLTSIEIWLLAAAAAADARRAGRGLSSLHASTMGESPQPALPSARQELNVPPGWEQSTSSAMRPISGLVHLPGVGD